MGANFDKDLKNDNICADMLDTYYCSFVTNPKNHESESGGNIYYLRINVTNNTNQFFNNCDRSFINYYVGTIQNTILDRLYSEAEKTKKIYNWLGNVFNVGDKINIYKTKYHKQKLNPDLFLRSTFATLNEYSDYIQSSSND
jgi:hypothetical protein